MQQTATNQALRTWGLETESAQAMWTRLRAAIAAAIAWALIQYRVLNAQRRLRAMDDHMLTDIGIARWDIERVVQAGRPTATYESREFESRAAGRQSSLLPLAADAGVQRTPARSSSGPSCPVAPSASIRRSLIRDHIG